MIANRNYEDCEPLTWVGRMPVYLSTALAAIHATGMIITALFMMSGLENWFIGTFSFLPPLAIEKFHVWQFVTYAFVARPEFTAVVQIVLLAVFGREVERYIGRRSFAWLYGLLLIVQPVIYSAFSFLGMPDMLTGAEMVLFAIFIGYVLLYPSAEGFFGIQFRWYGIAFLAFYTLQYLAGRSWVELAAMWSECLVAAFWLAREGFNPLSLPTLPSVANLWRQRHSRKNLRVVRTEEVSAHAKEEGSVHDSIDPILEKIARRGIGSLTRAEREKLERARTALLEKERSS